LQKIYRLIGYVLVAVCCVTQTVPPVKATDEESEKESWRRVGETVLYRSSAPTKVTVIGNSVLIPVTLLYQGNEVDVQLLLDTGASRTVIHTEIADRLNVDLATARKARGTVVGGAVIEAYQVTLSRLTVGPRTKENIAVFVIPHKGPPARYDGLLGMDVLGDLKYTIDLERRIILWE